MDIKRKINFEKGIFLSDHIETYVVDAGRQGNEEQVLEDMKTALDNFIHYGVT